MKRSLLGLVVMILLAMMLAGCVDQGFAGQENPDATASGQAATGASASPAVGDAQDQDAASAAGQAGAWERHRFFDVWEIGYPDGWTVERPGTGAVLLSGAYGEHEYQVELMRPTGVQTEDLAAWVQSDLETANQAGAPRQELSVEDLPAMKVTNLNLPGQPESACPAARVYMRTDKFRGEQNYLVMTISQTDAGGCDAASVEQLAEALAAAVRP